jgi:hypothetical protein
MFFFKKALYRGVIVSFLTCGEITEENMKATMARLERWGRLIPKRQAEISLKMALNACRVKLLGNLVCIEFDIIQVLKSGQTSDSEIEERCYSIRQRIIIQEMPISEGLFSFENIIKCYKEAKRRFYRLEEDFKEISKKPF